MRLAWFALLLTTLFPLAQAAQAPTTEPRALLPTLYTVRVTATSYSATGVEAILNDVTLVTPAYRPQAYRLSSEAQYLPTCTPLDPRTGGCPEAPALRDQVRLDYSLFPPPRSEHPQRVYLALNRAVADADSPPLSATAGILVPLGQPQIVATAWRHGTAVIFTMTVQALPGPAVVAR